MKIGFTLLLVLSALTPFIIDVMTTNKAAQVATPLQSSIPTPAALMRERWPAENSTNNIFGRIEAQVETQDNLWQGVDAPPSLSSLAGTNPRAIAFDAAKLLQSDNQTVLQLPTPYGHEDITITNTRISKGVLQLQGKLNGGTVLVTTNNDFVYATITTPQGNYILHTQGGIGYVYKELSEELVPLH